MVKYTLEEILEDVKKEFEFATEKWEGFSSLHEAYAIVLEEVDELWENVKRSQKSYEHIELAREEAIQVATMSIRLIYDCCEKSAKMSKKCALCGKKLTDYYMSGERVGTIAIYGDTDNSYCSNECYRKSQDKKLE